MPHAGREHRRVRVGRLVAHGKGIEYGDIGKGTDAPFVVSLTRTLQDGTVLDPLFTSAQASGALR